MLKPMACSETVSIIEAVVMGADGACIDIGMVSLLGGVALFIGGVVLLQYAGARAARALIPSLRRSESRTPAAAERPQDEELRPMPYESPIRSTGAWGGKPR